MRTLDDQALKTLVADFIEFLRFNRNASEHTALAYAGDLPNSSTTSRCRRSARVRR